MYKRISTLFIALFISFCASAQQPVIIESYAVDEVAVYDSDGNWLKDIATKNLPAPIQAKGYDPDIEMVRIDHNGESLWLDTMNLQMNINVSVAWNCKDIKATTLTASTKTYTTMGMGGQCKP